MSTAATFVPAPSDGAELDVSVVVPVDERPAPLDALYREYSEPLRGAGARFEFLFVVDPAFAALTAPARDLRARGEPVRVLQMAQRFSGATLLKVGADAARGAAIVALPAYPRVEAGALPALLGALREGAEVAVARRWPRRDRWPNRIQNALFNQLLRGMGRRRFHDVASGVAAMPRSVLRELPLYGDFARFLPLMAERAGYRVDEVDCPQHPDDARPRLHGPGVYLRRLIDVLGVFFVLRFREKPLRFFGLVGGLLFLAGSVLLGVLAVQKLGGQDLANRPLLLLAVLLVVLGIQAVALGLIGEIIVHLQSSGRRSYRLARDD